MNSRGHRPRLRRKVIAQPDRGGIISPQGRQTPIDAHPGPSRAGDQGAPCWTHVTQALCTDGSAVNNVIRELTREAGRHEIRSAVAASDNRGNVFPDAELLPVDFLRYLTREYLTTSEAREDILVGHLGLRRRNVGRLFRPVAEALDATDGPIVVHDGLLGAAGLATIRARHPRRPLFLYVHNSLSRGYARRELRRFLSLTDAVICVSGAMRAAIAAAVGDHPVRRKLVVIHNGVDGVRFHPGEDGTGPVPSILFVGMMREIKGPHVLMAALRTLQERGVSCTATFLGSTTHAVGLPLSAYEDGLRRDQAALGRSVTFRPFVPNTDVPSIYRQHDILVVPSQFDDPCPLVLFEGMASGLAAVASRRGGIPEIGAQSIDYFDDVDGLAAAIEALVTDSGRRRRQSARARERALELSWASSFEQVQAVVGRKHARL